MSVCRSVCHKLFMLLLISSRIRYLLLFSSFNLSPRIKIILMHADKCRHTQKWLFFMHIFIDTYVNANYQIYGYFVKVL